MKRKIFSRLLRDEQGSVLPLFGIVVMVLLAVTGIAVDYGRGQMVQGKLHSALDASGLAAAAVGRSRDVNTEVEKFMEANFPPGYMDARVTELNIDDNLNPEDNSLRIDLSAKADVDTVFMNIFGFDVIEVEAKTQVINARRRGFEMVMVLDNSGSMGEVQDGVTRREAMVNAANQMLETLYGGQDYYENIYIGLVPFNHTVRVGNAKTSSSMWLRANSPANVPIPDSINTPISGDLNCVYTNMSGSSGGDHTSTPSRHTDWAVTTRPPLGGDTPPSLFVNYGNAGDCKVQPMTPLKDRKSEVETALGSMASQGNTRVDLGAIWGWRMLHPSWRELWQHDDNSLPLDYNTPNMDKVMIILTDGVNCCGSSTVTEANARLTNACTAMKSEGIHVYTITFHIADMDIRNRMKDCATSEDHYFHASGNESIEQVFNQIADALMNLRISE